MIKPGLGKFALITLLITLISNLTVLGQREITGGYIHADYPGGYLILNSDKSFKFRFHFDLQWDLACGQYVVKNDTIFFTYTSDMFDIACNSEKIIMTDTAGYFQKTGVDKRFRPITARLLKNKIQVIKIGDVQDPETISRDGYSFKRKRIKKGNKRISE